MEPSPDASARGGTGKPPEATQARVAVTETLPTAALPRSSDSVGKRPASSSTRGTGAKETTTALVSV